MEDSKNKLEALQVTSNAPNASTAADTIKKLIDELRSMSIIEDRRETNAVDKHRHLHDHESLDVERLKNLFSTLLLHLEKIINKVYELKWIYDSYEQKLLSNENRIKQLTVENNNLRDENIALHVRIDDLVLQLNNSNANDLNEECLLKIFSYLYTHDMMQVQRVCKKWRQVSQQWFKRTQTLVYHAEDDDTLDARVQLYEKYYGRMLYENDDTDGITDLISILHSSGHFIKYFKADIFRIGNCSIEESAEFICKWVPQLCKNIVNFEFTGKDLLTDPLELNYEFMVKYWDKLERIKIEYLPKTVEENFLKLLQNNNQLKTLELWFDSDSDDPISDNFFTCLPKTIKKLSLRKVSIVNKEQWSSFIAVSKNFTSLQSLELSDFDCLSDDLVAAIVNITSLTHLSLKNVIRYESSTTINQIAKLKGLKSLYLVNNVDPHQDSVINIVESCSQLEALRIYGQRELTYEELVAISKLKKLKCLDIDMDNVTAETIINLYDRLEVVFFRQSKINESDAITFLKKATNLKYVDFISCENITTRIVSDAEKIANDRKNNILVIGKIKKGFPNIEFDTPYFKYFKYMTIPLRIFSNDIESFINGGYGRYGRKQTPLLPLEFLQMFAYLDSQASSDV